MLLSRFKDEVLQEKIIELNRNLEIINKEGHKVGKNNSPLDDILLVLIDLTDHIAKEKQKKISYKILKIWTKHRNMMKNTEK